MDDGDKEEVYLPKFNFISKGRESVFGIDCNLSNFICSNSRFSCSDHC